jgi:hypothetical protein
MHVDSRGSANFGTRLAPIRTANCRVTTAHRLPPVGRSVQLGFAAVLAGGSSFSPLLIGESTGNPPTASITKSAEHRI